MQFIIYCRHSWRCGRSPGSCSILRTFRDYTRTLGTASHYWHESVICKNCFHLQRLSKGVFIRFHRLRRVREMTVILYIREDRGWQELSTDIIEEPNSGVMKDNLDAGNYTAYVFVRRHDCHYPCPDSGICDLCPHTSINFTLVDAKFTPSWRALRLVVGAAKYLAIALIGPFCHGLE